ncbi:formylglycine-generating enzyme [Gammaproteobacteria bacterium]
MNSYPAGRTSAVTFELFSYSGIENVEMLKTYKDCLSIGAVILNYQIERVLGQGGFGITYLAKNLNDQTLVAIKEYFPKTVAIREKNGQIRAKSSTAEDIHQFEWGLDRFRKEVLTLAKFDHENIVPVLYFFEALGTVYMVMPFIEGENLKTYLSNHPMMTESELLKVVLPLLDGLEVMHRAGYLHRDIKPDNILICQDGRPILLDFGATRQAMGVHSPAMTIVLTPGYSPIEQSYQDNKRQGPWSDIFSMGAVIYYAITGKKPPSSIERMIATGAQRPDPLPSLLEIGKGKYRKHFLLAIEHALRISESDRPRTVSEWKYELLGDKNITSPTLSAERKEAIVENSRGQLSTRLTKSILTWFGILLGMVLMGWAGVLVMGYLVDAGHSKSQPLPSAEDSEKLSLTSTLGPPTSKNQQSFEPEMISIPVGNFLMGSPTAERERDNDEGPLHRVNIRAFTLGKYEVTVGEFRAFVSSSGYHIEAGCFEWDVSNNQWVFQADGYWDRPGFSQTDRNPVACVNWNDAQAYIRWLAKRTAKPYRLPTEAEWEYAARAGTTTAWYWGENLNSTCQYANVADQTKGPNNYSWIERHECSDEYFFSAPVGSFQPNGFGLYDILGNVWEWTCSEYQERYSGEEQRCSSSNSTNGRRVLRGNSWYNGPWWVRVADRYRYSPEVRYSNLGFRVAHD